MDSKINYHQQNDINTAKPGNSAKDFFRHETSNVLKYTPDGEGSSLVIRRQSNMISAINFYF